MNRQRKRTRSKIPPSSTLVRYGFLLILFTAGLCAIIATGGKNSGQDYRSGLNPYKMASGPNAKKINALINELNRLEWEEANTESEYSHVFTRRINQIHTELATLGHKVELYSKGCFTPDMMVLTENGAKPIPDIEVGDRVLSSDEAGRQVMADVLNTYEFENNHYYRVNARIKVTAQHRFYTDSGWKKAKDLEVGDRIQTTTGEFEKIDSIEWVAAQLNVYNLTISKNHNFYVSPDGKQGYLVHNTAGGGGGGGGGGGSK